MQDRCRVAASAKAAGEAPALHTHQRAGRLFYSQPVTRNQYHRAVHYALISFLNARPLWWGLTHRPQSGDICEFTSPARCADLVADGIADLGLIPAIELARLDDVVALPQFCIASTREVRSVLLFSRVPFDEITSVALDPSSRTSVTLARILLAERLGEERYRRIKFDPAEQVRLTSLEGHDAVVVIGDPALQISKQNGDLYRYDLVSEWNALFDEPFVFAVWAGPKQSLERVDIAALSARLEESRAFGLAHLDEIAQEAATELGIPEAELLEYFREALHYEMGESERRALARFYALATKYGLLGTEKRVEWLDVVRSS